MYWFKIHPDYKSNHLKSEIIGNNKMRTIKMNGDKLIKKILMETTIILLSS
jgi:hypothetical protein